MSSYYVLVFSLAIFGAVFLGGMGIPPGFVGLLNIPIPPLAVFLPDLIKEHFSHDAFFSIMMWAPLFAIFTAVPAALAGSLAAWLGKVAVAAANK